jgi:hypothetical protein
MYLFVFLWVPSLQEAGGAGLPLGYIFSAFMISMMLGSIVYTTIATTAKVSSADTSLPTNGHVTGHTAPRTEELDSLVVLHAKLAALVCGVASLLFAYSATGSSMLAEHRFWAFCAFEACVGMYYPVMGMLRGTLVANEVRATVSNASFELYFRLSRILTNEWVLLAALVALPSPPERFCDCRTLNWGLLRPPSRLCRMLRPSGSRIPGMCIGIGQESGRFVGGSACRKRGTGVDVRRLIGELGRISKLEE